MKNSSTLDYWCCEDNLLLGYSNTVKCYIWNYIIHALQLFLLETITYQYLKVKRDISFQSSFRNMLQCYLSISFCLLPSLCDIADNIDILHLQIKLRC